MARNGWKFEFADIRRAELQLPNPVSHVVELEFDDLVLA